MKKFLLGIGAALIVLFAWSAFSSNGQIYRMVYDAATHTINVFTHGSDSEKILANTEWLSMTPTGFDDCPGGTDPTGFDASKSYFKWRKEGNYVHIKLWYHYDTAGNTSQCFKGLSAPFEIKGQTSDSLQAIGVGRVQTSYSSGPPYGACFIWSTSTQLYIVPGGAGSAGLGWGCDITYELLTPNDPRLVEGL